jgi:uncharacterized membrane protein YphA (DoxX/SURF4 family)
MSIEIDVGSSGWIVANALGAVFLAAAVAKIGNWPGAVEWFIEYGIRVPRVAAGGVILSELLLVALLISAPKVGGAAAATWLTVATLALIRAVRKGMGCACFGRPQVGLKWPLYRNALLLVGALTLGDVRPPNELTLMVSLGPAYVLLRSAVGGAHSAA